MTLKLLLGFVLLTLFGVGFYHSYKPLPAGLAMEGNAEPLIAPKLLIDRTTHFGDEAPRLEHEIFDEVLAMIDQARSFILVDMFLFNSTHQEGTQPRPLAQQLTNALIQQKEAFPDIQIVVISDPINTVYGGAQSPEFSALRAAGIPVIETDLTRLRDSNPIWSSLWRLCCQWFKNQPDSGWLPNPIGGEQVTLRSYLTLLNFKANHRKVLVTDTNGTYRALVTSANPHDGSSHHSNIGISFEGPAVNDILHSEKAVIALSGGDIGPVENALTSVEEKEPPLSDATVQVLTESAIRDAGLEMIQTAQAGDRLDMAMFYLSHREIIKALIQAKRRGVYLRILLDANHDAFGREKSGIPNRQAALDLNESNVPVRWCNTRGEQCHSKLLIRQDQDGGAQMLLGSANFTRRNLDDLNLETNVRLMTSTSHPIIQQADLFFEAQWNNGPGSPAVMSLPYKAWADESLLRYWQYRFMEATGLSTF